MQGSSRTCVLALPEKKFGVPNCFYDATDYNKRNSVDSAGTIKFALKISPVGNAFID